MSRSVEAARRMPTCSVEGCARQSWARSYCGTHYQMWRRHGTPVPPRPTLTERIWAHVVRAPDGCWLWNGDPDARGSIVVDGRAVLAYRVLYELIVEPIPLGTEPDHLCRRPGCVNPAHLECVTHRENSIRAMPYRQHRNGRQERTHCPRGHPYDEVNTWVSRQGHRQCRACNRERARIRAKTSRTGS